MVEAGDDDLVPRLPRLGNGPADAEGQAGHVLAEDDLLGAAGVEQVAHRLAGGVGGGVGLAAGQEWAAVVAAAAPQVVGQGVDDAGWRLRAAGAVQKDGRLVAHGALQGRELVAQGLDIEGGGHGVNSLLKWTSLYCMNGD